MKAYKNAIKFTEFPDVDDIQREGRHSRVGRIPRGEYFTDYSKYDLDSPVFKVQHNDRGHVRPSTKAVIRRALKRSARQIVDRFETLAEN